VSKDTWLIVGVVVALYFLYSQQAKSNNTTPRVRSKASRGSYAASAHR